MIVLHIFNHRIAVSVTLFNLLNSWLDFVYTFFSGNRSFNALEAYVDTGFTFLKTLIVLGWQKDHLYVHSSSLLEARGQKRNTVRPVS